MKRREWLNDYEQLLHDPSAGTFQRAVELKALHRPHSLFKYRSVTDQSLESLQRGYVWLSHPHAFNDGYDSAILVDRERLIAASMRRTVRASIARHGLQDVVAESDILEIEKSDDPSRALGAILLARDPAMAGTDPTTILDALATAGRAAMKDFEHAAREMARASIVVCSFADAGNTPALWAHYADNGSGFCIEYDLDQLPPDDIRLRLLLPVIYGRAPFDATFLFEHFMVNGLSDLTVRWPLLAATYKDQHWSYEGEWRLVRPDGVRHEGVAVSMPMKAVYLGTSISPENAAKVTRAAESHRLPAFRMQLGRDASALAFSAIATPAAT